LEIGGLLFALDYIRKRKAIPMMIDRRYYLLIGIVAALFCLGSLVLGVDSRNVARRSVERQKQDVTALNEQLQQDSKPNNPDAIVVAEY
jgi:hypothetical protein